MRLFFAVLLLTLMTTSSALAGKSYTYHYNQGCLLYDEKNYSMALEEFLKAYEIDSANANINYKVGICYLKNIPKRILSTRYLEKAVLNVTKRYLDYEPNEKAAPVDAYYAMGQVYHIQARYDEAIYYLEKYKAMLTKRQVKENIDANRLLDWCANAKEFLANPTKVEIRNMGDSINSQFSDYGPVISADENTLIFTSRREGMIDGRQNDRAEDGQYYEDIYYTYRKPNGTWSTPLSIGPNINTPFNESTIALSADAQQLLIYKDEDIYFSSLNIETWTVPEKMGTGSPNTDINTGAWEPSACLSRDGNTIYFVSDRKGGIGGRDIWRCVKLPNGKWSMATNLGRPINTEFDEDAPFIHPDEVTLYFSSNGHKTMGGFDIFYSQFNEEKGWSLPTNMGYPINTPDEDVFYVTSPNGKRGYFSSDRPGGLGGKDIYVAILEGGENSRALALIKGTISPEPGKALPEDLLIEVTNRETGQPEGTFRPLRRNGSFSIIIPPNSKYRFSYQANGKEFYGEDIDVPAGTEYTEILKELTLAPRAVKNKETEEAIQKDKKAQEEEERKSRLVSVSGRLTDKGKPVDGAKITVFDNKNGVVLDDMVTTDKSGDYKFKAKRGTEVYLAIEHNGIAAAETFTVKAKDDQDKIERKASSLSDLKNEGGSKFKYVKSTNYTNQQWAENDAGYHQIIIKAANVTPEILTNGGVLCYYNIESGSPWLSLPTTDLPYPINVSYSTNEVIFTLTQNTSVLKPINIKMVVIGSEIPKWLDVTNYKNVQSHYKLTD